MVDERLVEALLSAKISRAAGHGSAPWRELVTVVAPAAADDPALAAAWTGLWADIPAGTDASAARQALRRHAVAVVARAAENGAFLDRLRLWMARHPVPADGGQAVTNSLAGDAQVHGPVVQAQNITGGIHIHQSCSATAPPRPAPRQLPPPPAHFTDRLDDMRALDALRGNRDPETSQVIVLSGQAGVGKTALASRWLAGRLAEFPDCQLYVDMRGGPAEEPAAPGEILGALLRALGETAEPPGLAERAALWRSATASLRFCLMVDNALTAAEVRVLLPSAPGALVLATSRHRLTGLAVDGAAFHRLDVLGPRAAKELFTRGAGRVRAEREPGAVGEIVALCAGLPLALRLAAARLATRPDQLVASLLDSLTSGAGPLGELRAEGVDTVQTVLDAAYGVLAPDAAGFYRRLGLLPTARFDAATAAAVGGVDGAPARRLIDALVEANLLEPAGADATGAAVFRFHALVRLHAAQRAEAEETAPARDEAVRRYAEWCLAMATSAEELLSPSHCGLARTYHLGGAARRPFADAATALTWLEAHRDALTAAVRQAAEAGWHDTVWQLVDALWPMFLRLRLYDAWIEAHELGLAAARADGVGEAQARMLTSGGIGLRSAGRYEEAAHWFHQALDLARAESRPRDEAQALSGLGSTYRDAGRLDQATEAYERALTMREAIGYLRGAALSRLRLGELALQRGAFAEAADRLGRALHELTQEHDAYDAARARALFGYALARAGRHDEGVRELRTALGEFDATGSAYWRGRTLELLGVVAEHDGDLRAARGLYEEALLIFGAVGPVDQERTAGRLRALRPEDAPP